MALCCGRPRKKPSEVPKKKPNSVYPQHPPPATKSELYDPVRDILEDEGKGIQESLWGRTLVDSKETLQSSQGQVYTQMKQDATFESSMQLLKDEYSRQGFASRMPTVTKVLESIRPFNQAITTISQSSDIACLLWGSIQFVMQTIMRTTQLFDGITDMLASLSRDLPRFQAFTDVLITPRLHECLRGVYRLYFDFFVALLRFLRASKLDLIVKAEWSAVAQEYEKSKKALDVARKDFDAEVQLADAQEQKKRHEQVMDQFSSYSGPTLRRPSLMTNVPLARNTLFSGREEVMVEIHKNLQPNLAPAGDKMSGRRSCAIHGTGGMGKTETALEYTYRYGPWYEYVFWFHCQSQATLLESFFAMLRRLKMDDLELDVDLRIKIGHDWLQSTEATWLLVFDNAEEVSIVNKFWPPGDRGAIIITSQNPVMATFCHHDVPLQPLTATEGCSLIQRYLNRGRSEQESGEMLSENLGGLPLAISHFAGYVTRTQCTINDINKVLENRFRSSQIWESDFNISLTRYDHTLSTVWDLAWSRLNDDSRQLLRMLAFLNPDAVPEDMFIGSGKETHTGTWEFWDRFRFNEAIMLLRDRHLVGREETKQGVTLRVHRALQRNLLHKLDADVETRETVFNDVVSVVRNVFPVPSIIAHGGTKNWEGYQRYIGQLIALNTAFQQTIPPIDGNVMFSEMCRDVGYYLMTLGEQPDAIPILKSAKTVCESLIGKGHLDARITMADAIGTLQMYYSYMGIEGKQKAKDLTVLSVEMRQAHAEGIPESEWKQLDHVNHGRSFIDLSLVTIDDIDEARKNAELGIQHYEKAGGASALPARIGFAKTLRFFLNATKNDDPKALDEGFGYVDLVVKALKSDDYLALQAKTYIGQAAFRMGQIAKGLELHLEVLEARKHQKGAENHETLASKYLVAVYLQNLGELEEAESHLREIIERSKVNIQWGNEDVARINFRLSVVLGIQRRSKEAKKFRDEAMRMRSEWEEQLPAKPQPRTDMDEAELFDFPLLVNHGRTSGVWSDGEHW